MSESKESGGLPSVPPYLLELPDSVVKPPVTTLTSKLPFEELSWEDFERLVYRLVDESSDVVSCGVYGRPGQNQHGIDVYARLSGGGYSCWQARNREHCEPSDITKAIDDFLAGKWAAKAKCFALCIRASLADTRLQDRIEEEANRLSERDIDFEAIDGAHLGEKLRSYPEIVHDFFGREWVVRFIGAEAADVLGVRLEARRLNELRQYLGKIYEARIHQLDPGLEIEPSHRERRDLRERFVVPNVDPINPFVEPLFESEVERSDPDEYLDQDWEFDDYGDLRKPVKYRKLVGELPEASTVTFDDWLLRGKRAMLISGAPGSGKSTILRCLALDLVHTPELFSKFHERLGARIPILIPFAIWTRLAEKEQREVSLAEVVRETFSAFVPDDVLDESVIKALNDKRLLLLVDGLDEYGDEQSARTTLATIETFVRTEDVITIATGRPAGLKRLGVANGYWETASLVELSPRQQRDFAIKLIGVDDISRVPGQAERFFHQLEQSGRLQSLAGNPLMLHGMLSVAAREIIVPNTRFELFQKLIEVLLDVHPARRATAAAKFASGKGVFSTDDVRREALAKLAFEIQIRGTDPGIDRNEALGVIEDYLTDQDCGPAWSYENARAGARQLTNVDADTSGLLVERSPGELAFCHAAFREHLAGLELATYEFEKQLEFVSLNADDPRWRGSILTLLKSLKRKSDVEGVLKAIRDGTASGEPTRDRRLLLADGAFATASVSSSVGRQAALDSLNRIEMGTNDDERLELLDLALDGPRTGPIGEAIVSRLERWWPGIKQLRASFFIQLGEWEPSEKLVETLELAIRSDTNQVPAAASLAKVFGGRNDVGERLISLVEDSEKPWVTAAGLDALSRGWQSIDDLSDWLENAAVSPSMQLRAVASLAQYRSGRRGTQMRDLLLGALRVGRSTFNGGLHVEIIDALTADWAEDSELHDACWSGIERHGPGKFEIDWEFARSMLMRLHREDDRVPHWVEKQIEGKAYFPFHGVLPGDHMMAEVVSAHTNVWDAVNNWFEREKSSCEHSVLARVAEMLGTDSAKRTLVSRLTEGGRYLFWPVRSLLSGWGINDPEVSVALKPLLKIPPKDRQHIAHLIPFIADSVDESFQFLMEICELPEISRTDFVLQGFCELPNEIDEAEAVSVLLRHLKTPPDQFSGEGGLFARFHKDPRVRELALERLGEMSPPLTQLATVYSSDPEIANLILQRAAPLPTPFRRHIARRATHRFDDEALGRVLRECELETDEHAMIQATIGLSYAALGSSSETLRWTEVLRRQLNAVGPYFSVRQVAAFAGLLALGRIDVFASTDDNISDGLIRIDLVSWFDDYAPAVQLAAENWDELQSVLGDSDLNRFSRTDSGLGAFWVAFAPYLSRSSRLSERFLAYCEDTDVVLEAPMLKVLEALKPESSLLLDCCKRALTRDFDYQRFSPLDAAETTVFASKCLAKYFPHDSTVMDTIVEASDSQRHYGGALVGLAARWPDHQIVEREYSQVVDPLQHHDLLPCVILWLISAKGTQEEFSNALGRYVTRHTASPWDFPQDSTDALQARLLREPESREVLCQFALESEEASIRGSVARLLSSNLDECERDLVVKLLSMEVQRTGPPRFALDIITNRIRPLTTLLRDTLRLSDQ